MRARIKMAARWQTGYMYFCALGEAVADYGAHYSSYCKLWGLVVADLVYGVHDKQLFRRELQLQLIGRAHIDLG